MDVEGSKRKSSSLPPTKALLLVRRRGSGWIMSLENSCELLPRRGRSMLGLCAAGRPSLLAGSDGSGALAPSAGVVVADFGVRLAAPGRADGDVVVDSVSGEARAAMSAGREAEGEEYGPAVEVGAGEEEEPLAGA